MRGVGMALLEEHAVGEDARVETGIVVMAPKRLLTAREAKVSEMTKDEAVGFSSDHSLVWLIPLITDRVSAIGISIPTRGGVALLFWDTRLPSLLRSVPSPSAVQTFTPAPLAFSP